MFLLRFGLLSVGGRRRPSGGQKNKPVPELGTDFIACLRHYDFGASAIVLVAEKTAPVPFLVTGVNGSLGFAQAVMAMNDRLRRPALNRFSLLRSSQQRTDLNERAAYFLERNSLILTHFLQRLVSLIFRHSLLFDQDSLRLVD